jgi:hypothetical protein
LAELSRRNGAESTWWRRRNRAQWLLTLAGLVVLAAVLSPTVRGALVGLVLLVALVAALTVGLLGRIVRRHPVADLAAGYLIGRRHARRRIEHYGPGYPPPNSYYYPPPPPIAARIRRLRNPGTRRTTPTISLVHLALRPFEPQDEGAAVAAHQALAPESFAFLLGYSGDMQWMD